MDIIEHKILGLLREKEEDITINEIADRIKIDRHTAAKRLEVLKSKGLVEYRTVGKSKMWKISKSPFLSALKNNDDMSNNIKNILQHVDGQINIQDKDKIIWSNTDKNNCCSGGKRCKNCAVEKTFKTGKTETLTRDWSKKKVKITTQPIKDESNNTIAVMEIIRDVK
ncbi:MAG: winged helix-turn-helix domain-containing protein [Candidatus Woesearchaeota archaeon]